MRVPVMPAMLLLGAAGLLYVIYQGGAHFAPTPRVGRPAAATAAPAATAPIDAAALSPQCQAILRAAEAAQDAAERGEAFETLLRRPVIAWQEDEALRERLRAVARVVYAAATPAPQRVREALHGQHCGGSELLPP